MKKHDFSRYLPIDESLFISPLYLTSAGRSVIPAGSAYPLSNHPDLYQFTWNEGRILPEFSLLLVRSGSGLWETKNGSYPICAGEVGLVCSGQWHRYRPTKETGWTECWVQFNGRLAHELEATGTLSQNRPIRIPASKNFAAQFLDFLEEIALPDFINSPSQGLRLAGLIGLLDKPVPPSISSERSLVEKAKQHIWSHSHRQLSVPEVARHAGTSRRTLERAFQAESGSSVLNEITRCRLNRAERLLRETNLPVQHIVGLAGFGTFEQMRLHFQKQHSLSPGQYRKNPPLHK